MMSLFDPHETRLHFCEQAVPARNDLAWLRPSIFDGSRRLGSHYRGTS